MWSVTIMPGEISSLVRAHLAPVSLSLVYYIRVHRMTEQGNFRGPLASLTRAYYTIVIRLYFVIIRCVCSGIRRFGGRHWSSVALDDWRNRQLRYGFSHVLTYRANNTVLPHRRYTHARGNRLLPFANCTCLIRTETFATRFKFFFFPNLFKHSFLRLHRFEICPTESIHFVFVYRVLYYKN